MTELLSWTSLVLSVAMLVNFLLAVQTHSPHLLLSASCLLGSLAFATIVHIKKSRDQVRKP